MAEALVTKDLCKSFEVNKRQNHVLKNINLTIEQGEMAVIMGPSGSGKTTLLHTVSGIEKMTAGEVIFFERKLANMKDKELAEMRLNDMGFVFQQMYMLENLSVEDNILLPAYQAKRKEGAITRRNKDAYCRELMQKMGIRDIASHDIIETSGGQLQRACVCRSLINNPKMIFADEPTGNLNKKASTEVMNELLRINREGTTIMLVTHDVRVAAVCDRVLYIIDGQIHVDYVLGKCKEDHKLRDRERVLNNWLLDLGW
ncbi:MAG: ABC transporter ATP-binding protein [Peptococcaceae bacterium]|nr:ABC transporter ATP-binding protein [Peptococcaceae bacterium]